MLTEHQQEKVNEILNNLDTHGYALLSGVAGTGKSFCTEYIVKEYIYKKRLKVIATAPTHKAVEVLARSMPSSVAVKTTHSHCNMRMVYDKTETHFIRNEKKPIDKCNLLIIDEFSFLSTNIIKVLHELLKTGTKILFVGDASQLIMDKEAIDNLNLDDVSSFLTEPQRQSGGSDIALFSKMASEHILGRASAPLIPYGEEIIKYDSHKDFIQAWKDEPSQDKVIIPFQNQVVKAYNSNIKQKYRFQSREYEIGNIITLRSSVTTHEDVMLYNKARIEILDIDEKEHEYKIYYKEDSHDYFRVPKSSTWLNNKLQEYVETKEWQKYYKLKETYVLIHHSEAQTCHSSQGDSYDHVFIDGTDLAKMQDPDALRRAIYVAISRARTRVHIFLGDKRHYDKFTRKVKEIGI